MYLQRSHQRHRRTGTRPHPLAVAALLGSAIACGGDAVPEDTVVTAEVPATFADFVEPDFPFITTTIDARDLDPSLPDDNAVTRGVVVLLGDSSYAAFDPDLLRMSVAWSGEFLSMTTMAQISYQDSLNKDNQIPEVLGEPIIATGIYPGWSAGEPVLTDPREPGPNPEDPGRGPLPAEVARWQGVYVSDDRATLAYTVGGTEVREQPGAEQVGGSTALVRDLRVGAGPQPLSLVAAELRGGTVAFEDETLAAVRASDGSLTAVGLAGAPAGARVEVRDARYLIARLPALTEQSTLRVITWRGAEDDLPAFRDLLARPAEMVEFEEGGARRWQGSIATQATLAPDTAAYVVDDIQLPLANPWRRNVRPSDIAFFSDGRAAVSTFEGDVWIASGMSGDLDRILWRRFASGLYEPMSIEVVEDRIYVYSRSGLVRPTDLNGDGEADFYENFSDLSPQTMESREFPLSMGLKPGGGFYLSRGGALDNGPRTSPVIMPGFRAGSRHSGSVTEVSEDGRSIRMVATGLREPFIGVHPATGMITSSDQQGNFVPSTPIYRIEEGAYYGVPATAHGADTSRVQDALTWIPHSVDQSGAGQAWVTDGAMGFGGDALIHVSYGRPGAFRIYFDEGAGGRQGAAVSLASGFSGPLLKAEQNPTDGQLYVAGFQVWGTRSPGVRVLARVRHTGMPSPLPETVSAGEQGVLLTFGIPLDSAVAADRSRYAVSRWDYRRTARYGSGHFRLDGEAGEERLPVAAAHVGSDGRSLLLVIPDMREAMQVQVSYDLVGRDGEAVSDTVYLTVNGVTPLDLAAAGLGGVDWAADLAGAGDELLDEVAAAATADAGREIFQRTGCVACHSADGTTAGRLGPTMQGLFGSIRPLADGSSVRADEEYLRRAITAPDAQIVEGYQEGMPAYLGVLDDSEIESIILYIRSLTP